MDANGGVTRQHYNEFEELDVTINPEGYSRRTAFNEFGLPALTTDEDGRQTRYTYDARRNLTSVTTPEGRRQFGRHVRFGYDGELQLREIVNIGSERYAFGLDGLGQVVEETGFDGLLLRAENGETKVAFKRDAAGRVVKETQGGHDIVRTFDPTGKHVHTESSLGASVDYGHDGQGRLQEMSSGEWTAKWLRDSVGLETERHLTGGVHVTTRRDRFGRETYKSVGARNVEQLRRRYTWDIGNRLLVARDEISGRVARFDYDEFDNLIAAEYERGGEVERLYRVPDRMGNLFETRERDDRRYDAGDRLAEDREHFYHYDCEGNLVFKEFKELSWGGNVIAPINKEQLETELGIRFRAFGTGWRYDWQSDGMLARVVRPDGKEVSFAYDALGRRIRKSFAGTTTHFVWDGNVPLHEWTEESEMVTWLFEQDTFVPAAKLVANGECFSIISDYLGTPLQAYDKQGNKIWEQELDIYGRQRKRPSAFIPFKYQGQYEDAETGLYYNRFRYYDPNAGSYISQDPIGLMGENPTLYGYVSDSNINIDILGLTDFYITPSGKAIPATGYRYVSKEAPYLDELKSTKTIPANSNGTYFSFDNFDTPNPKALQVPHDASVKASFDTLQIVDDVEIPRGKWGKADYLEPITKDFPEFGKGGATQAITHKEIKVDKIEHLDLH